MQGSLAIRYRPQTFAQVAGQATVTTVLSRAAAESRPAPAYLLSGTRGVGKTTIARIFAKALNCEKAPTPEPCNECSQCRSIVQGNHMDVSEIDGASNNSVDDARLLRENVSYVPMLGKFKVIIIDEAHQLTKQAFNALLKTLEEPPPRVVFVFATTEAQKFPVTILSRCQHFVLHHLTEDAIHAHLASVLTQEGAAFEDAALRLVARRAAGSVRDGLSLLDQVLALAGGEKMTVDVTRNVLGLAGQEFFEGLFAALQGRDCGRIAELTRQLLHRGVDIGFFVRELGDHLRNLFLLRKGGAAILPHLLLPDDEAAFCQRVSEGFSLVHLHAAWQMTLEMQRGIVHSPEPATALELLLLNLALLPQLMPVSQAFSDAGMAEVPPLRPVAPPPLQSPPHAAGTGGQPVPAQVQGDASAASPVPSPGQSPLPTEGPDVQEADGKAQVGAGSPSPRQADAPEVAEDDAGATLPPPAKPRKSAAAASGKGQAKGAPSRRAAVPSQPVPETVGAQDEAPAQPEAASPPLEDGGSAVSGDAAPDDGQGSSEGGSELPMPEAVEEGVGDGGAVPVGGEGDVGHPLEDGGSAVSGDAAPDDGQGSGGDGSELPMPEAVEEGVGDGGAVPVGGEGDDGHPPQTAVGQPSGTGGEAGEDSASPSGDSLPPEVETASPPDEDGGVDEETRERLNARSDIQPCIDVLKARIVSYA